MVSDQHLISYVRIYDHINDNGDEFITVFMIILITHSAVYDSCDGF